MMLFFEEDSQLRIESTRKKRTLNESSSSKFNSQKVATTKPPKKLKFSLTTINPEEMNNRFVLIIDVIPLILEYCDSVTLVSFIQCSLSIYQCSIDSRALERKKRDHYLSLSRGDKFVFKKDVCKDKHYYIHDNGGVPWIFKVSKDDKQIRVVKSGGAVVWKCDDYIGYWKGEDAYDNTILVEVDYRSYVWIGEEIHQLNIIDDTVREFWSPLENNNDVPYPIIVGRKKLYFLQSHFIPILIENFNGKVDFN